MSELRERIRAAWQGRVSGCQRGKPVELLSVVQGHTALTAYLARAGALPLRDYVPSIEGTLVGWWPVGLAGQANPRALDRAMAGPRGGFAGWA